ncbi:MAG: phosphohistidine phosphatase SixA [Candidatus Solibacter usitatus]|nr:phosphohistidine phosphatase SixA [Candidatus Solibacter usitatus]
MEIYLLRHGIAEEGRAGMRDPERALTEEGKRRLRATLKRASEADATPSLILTSPYVRARQTAEIALKCLAAGAVVLETGALTPGSDPETAWDEIRLHRDHAQVLCSSHEPLCGLLAAFLLGAPQARMDFKKGAMARIDVDSAGPHPRGVLKWMLAPKLA